MATREGTPPYMGPAAARDGMYRELTLRHDATDPRVQGGPRGGGPCTPTRRGDYDHHERLARFFEEGWNRHDLDRLMTFMADDCVFESTAGPEACGMRHAGRERVRDAFARVFAVFPDARFDEARHFVA